MQAKAEPEACGLCKVGLCAIDSWSTRDLFAAGLEEGNPSKANVGLLIVLNCVTFGLR
jgi:hypothetical protein